MRERRNQLVNRHRFGSELNSKHIQDALTEIIQEEMQSLTTSDWSDASIPKIDELLTEEQALELESQIIQEQGLNNIEKFYSN